jgi:hypothetical protein
LSVCGAPWPGRTGGLHTEGGFHLIDHTRNQLGVFGRFGDRRFQRGFLQGAQVGTVDHFNDFTGVKPFGAQHTVHNRRGRLRSGSSSLFGGFRSSLGGGFFSGFLRGSFGSCGFFGGFRSSLGGGFFSSFLRGSFGSSSLFGGFRSSLGGGFISGFFCSSFGSSSLFCSSFGSGGIGRSFCSSLGSGFCSGVFRGGLDGHGFLVFILEIIAATGSQNQKCKNK